MKVEILYFEGCPNHAPAVERVREVLREEGLAADVVEVNVRDEAAARALGFPGSPTIRVDGLDVEPAARSAKDFGMMCRTYTEGSRRAGLPPSEMIRQALREAAGPAAAKHGCCQTAVPGALEPRPPASHKTLLFGGSVVAAIGASLCCILPIVAAAGGAGVLAAGAAFEKWRPWLLGVTGVLLAGGFLLACRDHRKACESGSLCASRPMSRWNFLALAVVALLVIGLAAFPYYSGTVAATVIRHGGQTVSGGSAALVTVAFRIPDMDCPACAVSLSAGFRRLPGVADANVDYGTRRAVVTFDPAVLDPAALKQAVTQADFRFEPEPDFRK
ncbi:MAG: DF family (seleno)protein [Bryobacteraceae bacterium]